MRREIEMNIKRGLDFINKYLKNEMRKKAMQFSFSWIFAIFVGIFILFFSIYFITNMIDSEETEIDLKIGENIGILLSPLEAGFENAQTNFLTLPIEARIYGECTNIGNFGEQKIKISQLVLGGWTDTNERVTFRDKYIFSRNYSEGKDFYLFSKPFEMPFKVADLIYLSSSNEKYCFLNSPENINNELAILGQGNIEFKNCSKDAVRICFLEEGLCDIKVDYEMKIVTKGSIKMYFEGDALMYAAIFSEPAIYECQLKRLMQRAKQLALIYEDKKIFISRKGCNSNLNFSPFVILLSDMQDSRDLSNIYDVASEIKIENEISGCKLW